MSKRYIVITVGRAIFPETSGMASCGSYNKDAIYEAEGNERIVLFPDKDLNRCPANGSVGVLAEVGQILDGADKSFIKVTYRAYGLVILKNTEIVNFRAYAETESASYYTADAEFARTLFLKAKSAYDEYLKTPGVGKRAIFSYETANENMHNIIARSGDDRHKFNFFRTLNTEERILLFINTLREMAVLADIDISVDKKVKDAMDLNQREYYVREQIKALESEIGDEEDEAEEYYNKIDALNAPDSVKEKLRKEVRKTKKSAPASPDMALLKNYLDTVLELPWGMLTTDNEDLKNAQSVLDEDHYGLDTVKERLIEALAVRKLCENGRSPIICLVGPPGIGKTSIASSIARAMNKKFVRLSFGGVRDEAEIRGHRKTYVGAMPGRIISGIKTAGSMNPVFLMDEIDKMASDYKGEPASALLEVLDPEQNSNFRDHFMEMPFDLSKVLFITTANTLDTISRPLLDRMEIIEMTGYTEHEKLEIAKRHLIAKALKQNGVQKKWIKIKDEAILAIINLYTRESGVRSLEQKINAIMRKVARKFVENPEEKLITVSKANLSAFLGEARYGEKHKSENDQIGVVTGLAWTAVGGDTLDIEVIITEGKGETILTGNLGNVMQESAKIAISYCRGVAKELGVDSGFFASHDIHIHVPEGATPKDGPSAGITIATALFSAITNKKVDRTVAMTGELTLTGNVLPIGGLKEKSLAAVRSGVKKVFIPEENKKDYKELPENIKSKLEFVFVENVKLVLKQALLNA
ncbi:MAG: endopeptidase La [Firmicutes bacterium]|nr:endopeptidase La [Bacillota bacterium]